MVRNQIFEKAIKWCCFIEVFAFDLQGCACLDLRAIEGLFGRGMHFLEHIFSLKKNSPKNLLIGFSTACLKEPHCGFQTGRLKPFLKRENNVFGKDMVITIKLQFEYGSSMKLSWIIAIELPFWNLSNLLLKPSNHVAVGSIHIM